jgi:lipopolysaccharide/colanic/teichoic acid biosynthesis glycosyltransferase
VVLIPSSGARPPSSAAVPLAKSVLDRTVATLVLFLSGVCLALVALAVWLGDDGPLLSRERRIGQDGREFDLLRFRTGPWGPHAPAERTSWVGRTLRRYHLDELPVLVNVIRGDLSLVGPRPRKACEARAVPASGARPGLVRPWPDARRPRSGAEEARAVQDYLRSWSSRGDLALLWTSLRAAARGAAG